LRVGPYRRPGFWKIAVPGIAALAACGAAAPVAAPIVLALLALPALATAGDTMVFVRLRRAGGRLRWLHRVSLPPYIPTRFARNVWQGLMRGVPGVLVGATALALTLALDAAGVSSATQELLMRPAGIACVLLLALPVVRDRQQFRVAVVGDHVARRLVDPAGRLSRLGLAMWAAAALIVTVGFGLHPDLWPL
jgi:hypothetical protein